MKMANEADVHALNLFPLLAMYNGEHSLAAWSQVAHKSGKYVHEAQKRPNCLHRNTCVCVWVWVCVCMYVLENGITRYERKTTFTICERLWVFKHLYLLNTANSYLILKWHSKSSFPFMYINNSKRWLFETSTLRIEFHSETLFYVKLKEYRSRHRKIHCSVDNKVNESFSS